MTSTESAIEQRVPPRLCDAQGMVHAGRYHELLEDAFLDWLEANGLPYAALRARGLDLVIGTTTIEYRRPARLGDLLRVTARAARSSTSTVSVDFEVRCEGTVLANAATTYIAVTEGRSTPLPAELRS